MLSKKMSRPQIRTLPFALHAALARRQAPEAQLVAFDLLHIDGKDLCDHPLEQRRARLAELLDGTGRGKRCNSSSQLQFSTAISGDGPDVLRVAREPDLEGVVSKPRGSPYRSDRVKTWVKAVCTMRDSFAVIGAAGSPARALRLARLAEDELVTCGWAGSGLTVAAGRAIRAALVAKQPIIVDVDHRGLRPAGELRHPVVRAWRVE
jgi:bifunctional non-homologous end joining protein LigD